VMHGGCRLLVEHHCTVAVGAEEASAATRILTQCIVRMVQAVTYLFVEGNLILHSPVFPSPCCSGVLHGLYTWTCAGAQDTRPEHP